MRMAADYSCAQMAPCTFCDETHATVYEDDRCFVMLHDDSAVRGHAMVVWRSHVENLSDLSDDDATHFIRVHRAAERVLLDVTKCERAVLMKLGIATPHLHLHIYPVPASANRAAVMSAIDGATREEREDGFATAVRDKLSVC
jgi:diadenosine tetraphosphate (Ap4A) HIT family hydrolase